MKDHLLELLINFFAQCLHLLKGEEVNAPKQSTSAAKNDVFDPNLDNTAIIIRAPKNNMRVFSPAEQAKLTKASYQFLMRLMRMNIINEGVMELIMNRLLFSPSRFVTLDETKWAIRNTLADSLEPSQLAFLDLILNQEHAYPIH